MPKAMINKQKAIQALSMMKLGRSQKEIAEELDVSAACISQWKKKYEVVWQDEVQQYMGEMPAELQTSYSSKEQQFLERFVGELQMAYGKKLRSRRNAAISRLLRPWREVFAEEEQHEVPGVPLILPHSAGV
jgi:predicted transcriptional regulator